jgi:hypothetical protein
MSSKQLRDKPLVAAASLIPHADLHGMLALHGGDVNARTRGLLRMLVATIMATSTVASGGCYRYAPIDPQAPAPGAEVRVRLTDAGAITLAPYVGNRIELIDGHISSVVDTAVTVSVTGTTDRLGVEATWRGEQVSIPRTAFYELTRRTLDRRRSFVAGAIVAGVIVAIGIGFSVAGNGGGGKTGGTGSPK